MVELRWYRSPLAAEFSRSWHQNAIRLRRCCLIHPQQPCQCGTRRIVGIVFSDWPIANFIGIRREFVGEVPCALPWFGCKLADLNQDPLTIDPSTRTMPVTSNRI